MLIEFGGLLLLIIIPLAFLLLLRQLRPSGTGVRSTGHGAVPASPLRDFHPGVLPQ